MTRDQAISAAQRIVIELQLSTFRQDNPSAVVTSTYVSRTDPTVVRFAEIILEEADGD